MRMGRLRTSCFANLLVVWRFLRGQIFTNWKAVLRILAYINCTSGFGITHQRWLLLAGISLEFFADADYAGKTTDRRSVSGGATIYRGSYVCWFSRKQKYVPLSTSDA